MNIDEVESGKGLRFLPCKSPYEIFSYPGTRHEIKQRRVRARRERNKRFEEKLKNLFPNGRVSLVIRGQRNYYRVVISEKDFIPWQL